MPRGRSGLYVIPPATIQNDIGSSEQAVVAEGFGVSTRTVRRWLKVGMAPCYAGVNPSREQWEVFAVTNWRSPACNDYSKRERWLEHAKKAGVAPDTDDWDKPAARRAKLKRAAKHK